MSQDQIHKILEALPKKSMTTRLLGALDYIVPGEWENITNFEAMVKHVTGEEDQDVIQKVGERAIALYKDPDNGYQRAVQIFRLVDHASGVAGIATLASKFDMFSGVTPKADTTQAIDAAVKLVAELAAFCYCNGIPGDSVSDFAAALASVEKEDSMRLASWIVCDCLIPLGPDFLLKVTDFISSVSADELGEHGRFSRLMEHLPGAGIEEKRDLLKSNLDASSSAITGFISSKGINLDDALAKVKEYLEIADDKLDYLAAAIDLSTNAFEHTGIQTVARRVITRAYGEI